MNRFLDLQVKLFKYLRINLKQKRTFPQLVRFLLQTTREYLITLFRIYKSLFLLLDPIYQKQKATFTKQQELQKDLKRALKLLQYIDTKLKKQGYNRAYRRGFWRDFYKNQEVRLDVYKDLEKEIG